jgi:hypothetical protein
MGNEVGITVEDQVIALRHDYEQMRIRLAARYKQPVPTTPRVIYRVLLHVLAQQGRDPDVITRTFSALVPLDDR